MIHTLSPPPIDMQAPMQDSTLLATGAPRPDAKKHSAPTWPERRRIDARTAIILERRGVSCRETMETIIRDLEGGAEFVTAGLLERWASAAAGGKRAAAMALEFDPFRQSADLTHLYEVSLRPKGTKAAPGELAAELRRFADDYNRHVGRLVTRGLIRPLLAAIHIRHDATLKLWDIHAHCLWIIEPKNKDAVIKGDSNEVFKDMDRR